MHAPDIVESTPNNFHKTYRELKKIVIVLPATTPTLFHWVGLVHLQSLKMGVLSSVLNRFLGPYVKNLDSSQLKIAAWSGKEYQNLINCCIIFALQGK